MFVYDSVYHIYVISDLEGMVLVADMTEVVAVPLASHDDSLHYVVQASKACSSIVGLALDNMDWELYFSDVNMWVLSELPLSKDTQRFNNHQRQRTESSLMEVSTWRLFATKQWPQRKLTYCQLDHQEYISVKFESVSFFPRNWIWKHLRNDNVLLGFQCVNHNHRFLFNAAVYIFTFDCIHSCLSFKM